MNAIVTFMASAQALLVVLAMILKRVTLKNAVAMMIWGDAAMGQPRRHAGERRHGDEFSPAIAPNCSASDPSKRETAHNESYENAVSL